MKRYLSIKLVLTALAVSFSANVHGQEALATFEANWAEDEEPEGTYMSGVSEIGDGFLHITDAANGSNGGFTLFKFSISSLCANP